MKCQTYIQVFTVMFVGSMVCQAQSKTVGIVTQVKGMATIQEPGKKSPHSIEVADPITEGTRITTGDGGTVAFLFCPESYAAQAGSGSDITFTSKVATVHKGVLTQKHTVPYCRIPVMESINMDRAGGARDHVGGTGIRGGSSLVLVSPVRNHVELSGVAFVWKPINGASSYLIQVKSENGEVAWSGEVKEAKAILPSSVQLQPDSIYRWRVTAKSEENVLADASTWFKTLSAADQSRLRRIVSDFEAPSAQENVTKHLMLGSLYEELDMSDKALLEYQQIQTVFKTKK